MRVPFPAAKIMMETSAAAIGAAIVAPDSAFGNQGLC
jgi:hypothetical protein